MKMDTDNYYPIYSVHVVWLENIPENATPYDYPNRPKPPVGMRYNSVHYYIMLRQDKCLSLLETEAMHRWAAMVKEKNLIGAYNPEIHVQEKRYETWCPGWFSHWTFDNGETNEQFLDSFQRYVDRHEHYQHYPDELRPKDYVVLMLMGAEDRYRWAGTTDGDPEHRTNPPCRCCYCKEQGRVTINH
jgi:hypothetical protein